MKIKFAWTSDPKETFYEAIERIFAAVEGAQLYDVKKFDRIQHLEQYVVSIENESHEEIAKFFIGIYPNDDGEYVAEVESLGE